MNLKTLSDTPSGEDLGIIQAIIFLPITSCADRASFIWVPHFHILNERK